MAEDAEVETLTIRIPIRLQRRGGRKLIMTPEGAPAPAPKPRRNDTLIKALVRAHRWRRSAHPQRPIPAGSFPVGLPTPAPVHTAPFALGRRPQPFTRADIDCVGWGSSRARLSSSVG